jgi:hypothetical protein
MDEIEARPTSCGNPPAPMRSRESEHKWIALSHHQPHLRLQAATSRWSAAAGSQRFDRYALDLVVVLMMINRQAVHQKFLHGIVTVDEPWRHERTRAKPDCFSPPDPIAVT